MVMSSAIFSSGFIARSCPGCLGEWAVFDLLCFSTSGYPRNSRVPPKLERLVSRVMMLLAILLPAVLLFMFTCGEI